MKRYFGCCTTRAKIVLFRAYCESLYTANLWCNYRKKSLNDIGVAYNTIFRLLFCIPRLYTIDDTVHVSSASHMFVSRGVPSFQEIMRRGAYSLLRRVSMSDNKLVGGVMGSDAVYVSGLLTNLKKMLYTVFRG